MSKSRATNALTTNEVREVGGYPAVEGADDILVPSTLVPVTIESMIGEIPTGESAEPEPEDETEQQGADDDASPAEPTL
jgi:hypothetical protein